MNIFVLDYDPEKAAQMLCDKHVVKMVLETAQMLCAAFDNAPYKKTHANHPCTLWSQESSGNYTWLVEHGLAIAAEYTLRYGKIHKSQSVIEWCRDHQHELTFPTTRPTPFALVMPEKYRVAQTPLAYRAYYREEKAKIAAWNKTRPKPEWW